MEADEVYLDAGTSGITPVQILALAVTFFSILPTPGMLGIGDDDVQKGGKKKRGFGFSSVDEAIDAARKADNTAGKKDRRNGPPKMLMSATYHHPHNVLTSVQMYSGKGDGEVSRCPFFGGPNGGGLGDANIVTGVCFAALVFVMRAALIRFFDVGSNASARCSGIRAHDWCETACALDDLTR